MKLGEAIKLAKPDLFELSEARKDLLYKRILDSSTETLTYFSDQIRAELQDRVMRDCDDEDDLIELWEDDLIDERRETVNERIGGETK